MWNFRLLPFRKHTGKFMINLLWNINPGQNLTFFMDSRPYCNDCSSRVTDGELRLLLSHPWLALLIIALLCLIWIHFIDPIVSLCCPSKTRITDCVEQCSSETISCDDLCDLDCRAEDPFDKESSEPRYRLEDGRRLTKVPPRWDPIDHTWFNSSRREKCSSSMSFLTTSENCPRNQKRKYRK